MFFDRLFHRKPREREVVAGLRDQIIELGTAVRFLEADRLPPQPRDAAGRFVSRREIRRQQMAEACAKLTTEQRAAARNRALSMVFPPVPATQRLMRMQGKAS